VNQYSEHAAQAIETYASSPITLGGLARILGRNVFHVVRGWRTEGPALQVSGGNPKERAQVIDSLLNGEGPYLIDGVTLMELATLESLNVLDALPRVFVTTHTHDMINDSLVEALSNRSVGTAYAHEGGLGFIEISQDDREREVRFLRSIVDAMGKYCQVVPAYGSDAIVPTAVQLERALSTEEYSVLLAAAEHNATLISLDGRLRYIASALSIPGVWPQVLLMHGRDSGCISQATYSLACVRQLLSNRTFISVAPDDLVHMAYQGTNWLKFGLKCLKRHLSLPETDFKSALRVSLGFLVQLADDETCYVGAACELLTHLSEALFRHKDAPQYLGNLLVYKADQMLSIPKELIQMSILAGHNASRKKESPDLENVQVLMISDPPTIAFMIESKGEDDSSRQTAAKGSKTALSAMDGETTTSSSSNNLFR
jgi:hypothetical protein